MNRIVRSSVIAILLAVPATAAAQTPAPLSLTLDEAVRRGVEQAPRLTEARAHEAAAGANADSRRAAGLPFVSAGGSLLRTNHVDEFGVTSINGTRTVLFPDIPDNYRVRAEMNVPLYTAGRVSNLVDAARHEMGATTADRQATEQDVKLEVIRAYWALVTARETTVVYERGLERTDAYARDVRSRVEAGVASPGDLLTAQSQRARQAVRVVQARNLAAGAEIELARLIGAPAGQSIVTATAIAAPTHGIESVQGQTTDALIKRAFENRTERQGLEDRRASLQAGAAAALAGTKPIVSALAAVEPSRPNQRYVPRTDQWKTSYDLGINVSWPLFDGGRARADSAVASAQADAIDARLTDFEAMLAADVRQRLLDLDSNRAALAASDEAVAAATEARRVIEERNRAGVATNTDVLDAQVALLEAELERTMLAAALRLSEARLLRTVGGL